MLVGGQRGERGRAVGLAVSEVRGIVKRVFAREDVLEACARRDLGVIIAILGVHGVTQGQIAELTGIRQGRLSEWMQHKRAPRASSTFEAFADGLAVPAAARQSLGLAPVSSAVSGSSLVQSPGGRTARWERRRLAPLASHRVPRRVPLRPGWPVFSARRWCGGNSTP